MDNPKCFIRQKPKETKSISLFFAKAYRLRNLDEAHLEKLTLVENSLSEIVCISGSVGAHHHHHLNCSLSYSKEFPFFPDDRG